MIITRDDGPVMTWTISRYERRNALSLDAMLQLIDLASRIGQRQETRVVVLRGEQGVFCAGSDLKELLAGSETDAVYHESHWSRLAEAFSHAPIPIVAAIEGPALGGGMILASFCDIRLAAADAFFGLPEVALGWFPPGGIEELVEVIGSAAVRHLLLTNARLDAASALRLGFVDELVEASLFDESLSRLTLALVARSSAAVSATKTYFVSRRQRERPDPSDIQLDLFRAGLLASDTWRERDIVKSCG